MHMCPQMRKHLLQGEMMINRRCRACRKSNSFLFCICFFKCDALRCKGTKTRVTSSAG